MLLVVLPLMLRRPWRSRSMPRPARAARRIAACFFPRPRVPVCACLGRQDISQSINRSTTRLSISISPPSAAQMNRIKRRIIHKLARSWVVGCCIMHRRSSEAIIRQADDLPHSIDRAPLLYHGFTTHETHFNTHERQANAEIEPAVARLLQFNQSIQAPRTSITSHGHRSRYSRRGP